MGPSVVYKGRVGPSVVHKGVWPISSSRRVCGAADGGRVPCRKHAGGGGCKPVHGERRGGAAQDGGRQAACLPVWTACQHTGGGQPTTSHIPLYNLSLVTLLKILNILIGAGSIDIEVSRQRTVSVSTLKSSKYRLITGWFIFNVISGYQGYFIHLIFYTQL